MFSVKKMDRELSEDAQVSSLFELYRLVDHTEHEVYDLVDGNLVKQPGHCYDIWGTGCPCPNCVSKHTCNEDGKNYKMETTNGVVYLIQSVPVTIHHRTFSLELANDKTGSVTYQKQDLRPEIVEIIKELNDAAVHDPMTGLYNERYVTDQLQIISASRDDKSAVKCAAFTIDNIDEIEKKCGSEMVNTVLKRVASIFINMQKEPEIWAGKLGRASYALFYKDTSERGIIATAKKTVEQINDIHFRRSGQEARAAASAKIAEIKYGGGISSIDDMDFRVKIGQNASK